MYKTIFNGDKEQIVKAFRMLFEADGAKIIYYGDEIGMENVDIEAGIDTRRGVRGKFDWELANKEINDPSSLFSCVKSIIKEHAPGK